MEDNPKTTQPNQEPINEQNNPVPTMQHSGDKVIQPLSDMSAYMPTEQTPPTSTQVPEQPRVNTAPNPSSIYPNSVQPSAQSVAAPTQEKAKPRNSRVCVAVPSLKIYAYLILIFSGLGLITALAALNSISKLSSLSGSLGGISISKSLGFASIIALSIIAINLVFGIYLLLAKNAQAVHTALTVFFVISSLSFLRTVASLVENSTSIIGASRVNLSTIVGLLISGALLFYLWTIRTDVGYQAYLDGKE